MEIGRVEKILPLICALGCALTALGCGPSAVVKTGDVEPSDTNLATIGRMYAAAEQKLGRPPRNADELKPFTPAGADLKTLLISPTDNQPYVIVWGTKLSSTSDQYMVVAYERTGANGLRRVLTPTGTRMLSADVFAKSAFPPGHRPEIH